MSSFHCRQRAFFLHLKKWRLRGSEDTRWQVAGLGWSFHTPPESTVRGAGMSNNGKNRQTQRVMKQLGWIVKETKHGLETISVNQETPSHTLREGNIYNQ